MLGPYRDLLRDPRVLTPFALAVVARLPFAMVPLGLVVLIEEIRGQYASAGLVTGAFALATAVGTPVWATLLDRAGQPRVVAPTALASSAFLVALTLLAVRGAPDPVLVAMAALVGLTFPPMNPAMRVAWSAVLPEPERRESAWAMDAAAVETIFVAGPLALTALLAGPPALPLLATAGLMAFGGLGYARTYAARTSRAAPAGGASRGRSPLRSPGVVLAVATAAGVAIGFGHFDVGLTATAERVFASTGMLGVLFAFVAGGSAAGGLVYGARRWAGEARLRLPLTIAAYGAGTGLVALLIAATGQPPLLVLLPLLTLTGLTIAPSLIIQQALVDTYTAEDRRSEAQGWLSTGITAGNAVGMAIAGPLIDGSGPAAAFGGGAVALLLATLIAVAAQRWWRAPVAAGPVPQAVRDGT
ncbi:MFS transporter [Catenuloplanes atrovinosus]|uniref:MFS family arabinose efflux permease n=1 Tax=Catenuloplanes atrovinosus TaxID=137266 RepID=A0AAE4CB82_9ACTN|nr:MFS transporter [Catenuloplanes atrovinosus]MDR7276584.1 putative MFS family arabinose efflux permease [Catenuloplanes atrovinosus]